MTASLLLPFTAGLEQGRKFEFLLGQLPLQGSAFPRLRFRVEQRLQVLDVRLEDCQHHAAPFTPLPATDRTCGTPREK